MSSLVILGAGGFLGRAVVSAGNCPMPVKAVLNNTAIDADLVREGITWFAANLLVPTSLDTVLSPGDIVLNLAFMSTADQEQNEKLVDNIIEACLRAGVSRLMHCSTAVVA